MKKNMIALLLAALLLVMGNLPALASAPKVQKTDYEGNGVVEVDFISNRVQYKNAKVVVKNAAGKKLTARILEKDNDDLSFKVTGVQPGTRYTYTISGVRAGKSGSYGAVKGSFKTPAAVPEIEGVAYDRYDRELEVEFTTRVQFRKLKVVVKDESGKALKVVRLEKGTDDLEVKVKGMTAGKKYTVTVSGVRVKGKGSYVSVSKSFTA